MLFWALLFLRWAQAMESQSDGTIITPENITVQVLDAKTVQVFWSSVWKNVERFDVTYNPTEDKIVSQAAGDSKSIVLKELRPDTQYQVTITAVVGGKNFKSRRIVFRTAPDRTPKATQAPIAGKQTTPDTAGFVTVDPTAKYMPQTSSTVRGVELGLVLLALVVWIIAIALFFHRWGKIRMLLPYQPDYKTQQALKVPGTGTTMGATCTGSSGNQNQQEGPGCVQHMRWSSNCYDEKSTAKKTRWELRTPSIGFRSVGGSDCERGEYPEVITHSYPQKNCSTESIALCQLNQPRSDGSDKKAVTINVPTIARNVNDKRMNVEAGDYECVHYSRMRDSEMDFVRYDEIESKKYSDCPENVSDSIQNLFNCTAGYNFCQSKKSVDRIKRRYDGESSNSELEPLFFVGEKELYCDDEETSNEKIVVHHVPSPKKQDGREIREDILPQEMRPKRYSRTSLKKQKVSLYDERELDLYLKVPITEAPQKKHESVQTDFENDAKIKPKCNKHMVEMKRKAFLRKISLQDTYLNYNQDYWLDFKKSVRFHKSIDLGYFGNEECKTCKAEMACGGDKSKSKLTNMITEKSHEISGDPWFENGATRNPITTAPSKTHDSENRKATNRNSESSEGVGKTGTPTVMSDFQKSGVGAPNKCFLLPSNENIPLFCERNGYIETDFDIFGDGSDEERGPIEKGHGTSDSRATLHDIHGKYDFSQFYEVKLNAESAAEPVRRSTVFNFQGGHAFFGENRVSTSDDSDVFYDEIEMDTDPSIRSEQGAPQRISLTADPDKSRNFAKV